jgi:dynein heavy chain
MKVTVVNFTVTEEALSEQLLSEIVRLENTELEQRRQTLSKSIVQDQIKMIQIQEDILHQLVNSSESTILDDEDLIIYLDKSKLTNLDIKFGIEHKQHA